MHKAAFCGALALVAISLAGCNLTVEQDQALTTAAINAGTVACQSAYKNDANKAAICISAVNAGVPLASAMAQAVSTPAASK